jgi:hypothetical protein
MSLVFYALHRHDLRPKFLQEIQTTPPKHAPGFQFIEMQEFLYYMTLSIETCFGYFVRFDGCYEYHLTLLECRNTHPRHYHNARR